MGQVELTDAQIGPVRLWLVYSRDGKVLQLFKGVRGDVLKGAERAYPDRGPYTITEAVDCPLNDVVFAVTLAHGDWICTQFAMLAQAMNPLVRGVPDGHFRH